MQKITFVVGTELKEMDATLSGAISNELRISFSGNTGRLSALSEEERKTVTNYIERQ
jgi:hypothetical protein